MLNIAHLRDKVEEYFEKKTDIIEKVIRCEIEHFGQRLRLVSLVNIRNGWTGYFNDQEKIFSDLIGLLVYV